MEKITTTSVKTSWFNTPYDSSMYHNKFKRHTSWLIDTCELELTGRYKYVRHSPIELDIEVEYFYTPVVDERVVTGIEYDGGAVTYSSKVDKVEQPWAELGDGLEYRPIKRAWISSNDITIETTVEYVKEVSEIMECE